MLQDRECFFSTILQTTAATMKPEYEEYIFLWLCLGLWEDSAVQNKGRIRSCQQAVRLDKYNHAPLSFQGNYS